MIAPIPRLLTLLALAALAALPPAQAGAPASKKLQSRITWKPELRVPRAEKIFASPHDAQRLWVTTAQGIYQTLDGGRNWTLLNGSSRQQLGRISDAVFAPYNSQLIFLATREKGIFRSKDNGRSWENVGTLATGLSHLDVLRLICDPDDRSGRIYYATHGEAGGGLSKSIDGGQSWFTIGERFYAHAIALEGPELLIAARSKYEEDVWSLWHSLDSGATWSEILRDLRVASIGKYRVKSGVIWLGTFKGHLLSRPPLNRDRMGEWNSAGPSGAAQWTAVFGAFGQHQDDDVLYAYDPHRYGLLASRDGFQTWWAENNGLFVDRLIKDGANVCAAADGKTLYASINDQLFIGRTSTPEGPWLSGLRVTPEVLRWAPEQQLQFSVKLEAFDQDPKSKIVEAQVNLSVLRGSANTPLLDDGQHNDGAAGDGIFGASFTINGDCPVAGHERQRIPGQVMLPVQVRDQRNRFARTLLPITIFPKPATFVWWNGENVRYGEKLADARRTVFVRERFDDSRGVILEVDCPEARSERRCLHVYSARGPWLTGWGSDREGKNLSDCDAISFWIKAARPSTRDIKVMLTDSSAGENDANISAGVWLLREGYLKELRTEYQQVRIPVAKFMRQTAFRLDSVGGLAFGGDDPKGHNFFIDDVLIEVEGSPLPAAAPPAPNK